MTQSTTAVTNALAAINAMPDKCADILFLSCVFSFSEKEIMSSLGLPRKIARAGLDYAQRTISFTMGAPFDSDVTQTVLKEALDLYIDEQIAQVPSDEELGGQWEPSEKFKKKNVDLLLFLWYNYIKF